MQSVTRVQRCILPHRCLSTVATTRLLRPPCPTSDPSLPRSSLQRSQRQRVTDSRLNPRLPLRTQSFSTTSAAKAEAGSKTVDYLLADVGEGITECEIVKWFVEPGSTVEEFDVLVEVQSDKASVEITSRYAGRVAEHCYKVGEVARVGSALCRIEVQRDDAEPDSEPRKDAAEVADILAPGEGETSVDEQGSSTSSPAKTSTGPSPVTDHRGATLATPAVRRIVREHRVDIDKVRGTGKAGRVTKEDVQAHLTTLSGAKAGETTTPWSESQARVTRPLSGTRKAMYKAMSATWSVPHFGYSEEIDVTRLDQVRREMQASLASDNLKLTLMPFLIKALSLALYEHPVFRSTLDVDRMSLEETEEHRISIALSSPRGLLTPTLDSDIRNVSVVEIARQVQMLQRISAERGLNQRETGSGATVTLSNIGNIGGLYTFPLIPPTGQLVIGAVGRSRQLPRFDQDGNITKALILPASFSADHRVVEGAELARFVQEWKRLVESPMSWLVRLR